MTINPSNIILKPIYTEKSLEKQAIDKYYFWVNPKSNKDQIAAAFFAIFNIKPVSVNTSKIIGKIRTDWRTKKTITKPNQKKAIISVPKGKKIDSLIPNTK
ncbi:50S ribosomal protein L23 [Candidatus Shapirobacteria bacterium RIFOXYD1_FULL_38_32]|uniref:Large ribosomal subunit protein uL23 n=3 Tax=Candidatus Shapironibacteriota TaxID=1752721 RepID=A0A0G0M8T1_9BACT|nr:MAG: 50S ribosomal protein L23 [Candidatus Shapirobacteria bacterium GW2011_GWE2_38_30]KKQ91443.1 MAG: 50S ribosomal protein L23 [Candidatus Shapirobacteria bacterium GW2011_GWE1_38_92]OGL55862.1 MAG: 50S ribosomal protein L23 [Candidatus Shapirobacteria bacterium RIFOXYA1_FULL_39_17]OGL57091.1 MAG: 50S ribosomal protein L23 [Candidatus Shapirobacteria bacterium RIFOXYC1_FULL_38_24]OGL57109.1 MAG: 50S ribosomal protein L23 [Candidatus Shapirobacteria bacterium RIFOXYD1_FULL_38_32]OGL57446.1